MCHLPARTYWIRWSNHGGLWAQREKEVMRGTLNEGLESVRMPARHHHPRGLWSQGWHSNGSLPERARLWLGISSAPLWENLVNSILVPSPTLASHCPPKSRSCTMKCTYLPGPYNTHEHTSSPTTMPLTPHAHCRGNRDSPESACSVFLGLSDCVSLSVSLFLLLSLVHTFSQVVPSARNAVPFPSLLLLTLSISSSS